MSVRSICRRVIWPSYSIDISLITHYHLLAIGIIESTESKLNSFFFIWKNFINRTGWWYANKYHYSLVIWCVLAVNSNCYIWFVITKLDCSNVFKLVTLFEITNSAHHIDIKVFDPLTSIALVVLNLKIIILIAIASG